MECKILKVKTEKLENAEIRKGKLEEMPSIQEGWKFNFPKYFKLVNSTTYVLVSEEEPMIIQGCLVFQMRDKKVPYMAFVEVAPLNKGKKKIYDYVAGCLIAYAFKLCLVLGKGDYKGQLLFDVMEENEVDQQKLINIYRVKYEAKHLFDTTLYIIDDAGERLVEKYLPDQ